MRKTEHRTIKSNFTTREENGEKHIAGYFSVFGENYECGFGISESISPNAFDDALDDDVRVLWNHDSNIVLGRTKSGTASFKVDEHGLWGDVLINDDDRTALDCYARIKRGDVSQCSFGFDILAETKEEHGDGTVHYTIEKVKLYEGSPCTFPAYESTEIGVRRKQKHSEIVSRKKNEIKERMKWH